MIAGTTTATTMLRSGVVRSCGLQPIMLRSTATTCPYSTFSVRSKLPIAPFITTTTTTKTTTRPSQILVLRAAARATSRQAVADPDTPPLDWNTFFQLRKTRRRWQVAFSVVMSLASGTGGAILLSTGAADSLTSQIPLDPILTLGLMTIGFVALGWLAGPSLGSTVFYLLKRKYKTPMTVKESQFFARIKRNRVDPSNSSTGNPVPDFYGEKISSVAGYRQWLKDQRAYNKKRTTYIS
ncbi:Pam17-domain-containing protein [Cryphonectria parasitica EP155]|uniref:Presequence translocated-associated motor subunit PAM17 n=1 Tax=Cryphonectria parasitica (strain ATCC 38755 / EP155) TaxID=660469 RepID=A0A9P4XYA0_CRYP1|nr:Pam17-domain-containing protein [Cryphonectria parasitica EP155]KAF3762750.1 Pam17-domain-containing protein [Cryphonectria parasitica EP155]